MSAEGPLVSIIVCAYNAGDYLMPSLRSALEQTYRNIEVLVVDDGSTDGAVEQARQQLTDPRIRWFRQENTGKPVAMNFALGQVRGAYYALHDADDLSYPTRIERLVQTMETNPDVAAVYSGHDLIIDGRHVAPTFGARDREMCRRDIEKMRMPAHDPTGMYRMSMVGDMRYSIDLRVGQGYDYMLRVGERWPMLVVGECLYGYRIHDASVTRADPERRARLVMEVIRRACERRGIPFDARPAGNGRKRESRGAAQDNNLAAQFIDSVLDQRRARQRLGAMKTGWQCSRLHPTDPHYYKALVYAVSPVWLIRRIRGTATL